MELLKKVKAIDWIIAALGVIMLLRVDFSNVQLVDIIYMTVLIMWFLMLLLRLFLQSDRGETYRYLRR